MDNNNTNITNITFILLFKLDTIERLENIRTVVNFLFQHGFQDIRVIEGAPLCNGFVKELLAKRINYTFIKDDNFVFHQFNS